MTEVTVEIDMTEVTVETRVDRKIEVSPSGSNQVWLTVGTKYDPRTRISSILEPLEALTIGNALIEATGQQSLPFKLELPEVSVSDNGYYAETAMHSRPIVTTTIESIDEEIASLLALRGFIGSNGDLLHLYKVREDVAQEVFERKYFNCGDAAKTAVDRIIKAEGLAVVN